MEQAIKTKVKDSIQNAFAKKQVSETVQVILKRVFSKNIKKRINKEKVGIVVEGGGKGGVVTAYMLAAFELLGREIYEVPIIDSVDYIVGTSAAAFNVVWAASGKILEGKSTYHKHLLGYPFRNVPFMNRPPFIDFAYRPNRRSPFNMDFFEMLIREKANLDFKKISTGPKLELTGTRIDNTLSDADDRHVVFSGFTDLDDVIFGMLASSRLPLLSGWKPAKYHGEFFWDGGICEGIPISGIFENTCTHVLGLTTLPYGNLPSFLPFFEKQFAKTYMKKWDKVVADLYLSKPLRDDAIRQWLLAKHEEKSSFPYVTYVATNPGVHVVGLMDDREDIMVQAGEEGAKALFANFGIFEEELVEYLVTQMRNYFYE